MIKPPFRVILFLDKQSVFIDFLNEKDDFRNVTTYIANAISHHTQILFGNHIEGYAHSFGPGEVKGFSCIQLYRPKTSSQKQISIREKIELLELDRIRMINRLLESKLREQQANDFWKEQ